MKKLFQKPCHKTQCHPCGRRSWRVEERALERLREDLYDAQQVLSLECHKGPRQGTHKLAYRFAVFLDKGDNRWWRIIFLFPLFLSGCMGIYEGGFECPAGQGTQCKSISEVNELINRKQIPGVREQDFRSQACSVSQDFSDSLCTSPVPLTPDFLTPGIWWNPAILQEMGSSLHVQRDKGYGAQPL
jgi:hypothetical protein